MGEEVVNDQPDGLDLQSIKQISISPLATCGYWALEIRLVQFEMRQKCKMLDSEDRMKKL